MSERQDRALALAAVFQAARLVHGIAWNGSDHPAAIEASLTSLFRIDARDTMDIFGGVSGVGVGLRTMVAHLSGEAPADELPVMRYMLALLHLERRADADPRVWTTLRAGLEDCERQRQAFGVAHENTVAGLAQLYADVISPVGPRIMVEGDSTHLRDTRKAAQIRALLLAGIRASVLWRQLGASRWSLFLGRGRLLADARTWLDALV